MNLFERIHDIIKSHLGKHADENTPVDTQALANSVIDAHAAHEVETAKESAEIPDVQSKAEEAAQ